MGLPRAFYFGCFAFCLTGFTVLSAAAQERSGNSPRDLATVIEECEKSTVRFDVQASSNGPENEIIGSGFVVDANGLIATNAHVMEKARAAKVVFPNGDSFKVLGTLLIDKERDICIAKVDAKNMQTIAFASAMPRKGEKIIALGCPVGLSFSATVGVVSAVRKEDEMRHDTGISDVKGTWIQVDAALSPGNSGGPLINETGEVVAMSTLASVGLAQNLNFGISAEDIRKMIDKARNQSLAKLNPKPSRGLGGGGIAGLPRRQPAESSDFEADNLPMPRTTIPREILPPSRLPRGVTPRDFDLGFPSERDIKWNENYGPFTNKRPTKTTDRESLESFVKANRKQYSTMLRSLKANIRLCETEIDKRETEIEKLSEKTDAFTKRNMQEQRAAMSKASADLDRLMKIQASVSDELTDESLAILLPLFGSPVDTETIGSVGLLGKCHVLGIMSKQAILVSAEDLSHSTGLVWIDSSANYREGQNVTIGLVYFAGIEECPLPKGFRTNETEFPVYTLIDEAELKSIIFGNGSSAQAKSADGVFRNWTDDSGKFSVEAEFLRVDGDKVVLRRRDGAEVTVLKSKLSKADQKFLQK